MRDRKRRLAKLLSLPVLAVCGFAVAATLAGVSLAHDTSTTSTTSTTTTTTTTTTPTGNEGCTPGYWKNHTSAWVGFTTSQTVGSVFSSAPASVANLTLLQALRNGGGGVNALTRHAIAALLGAAHPSVDYPLTTTQIRAMVNGAFASGNAATIESLKDTLDEFNNANAAGFCD
jgi:hypothetical protein